MIQHDDLPWMPVSPGFELKLLRGGDDDDVCPGGPERGPERHGGRRFRDGERGFEGHKHGDLRRRGGGHGGDHGQRGHDHPGQPIEDLGLELSPTKLSVPWAGRSIVARPFM